MAQINYSKINKIEKSNNIVHNKVDASYTVFTANGEKYFQIDTYGSQDRRFVGKLSQSIQIDKETARYLVRLLKSEFDLED